jgi:hypothetical protein
MKGLQLKISRFKIKMKIHERKAKSCIIYILAFHRICMHTISIVLYKFNAKGNNVCAVCVL